MIRAGERRFISGWKWYATLIILVFAIIRDVAMIVDATAGKEGVIAVGDFAAVIKTVWDPFDRAQIDRCFRLVKMWAPIAMFLSLDMSKGFNQIKLSSRLRSVMGWSYDRDIWSPLRLFLGLAWAPIVFCSVTSLVFSLNDPSPPHATLLLIYCKSGSLSHII